MSKKEIIERINGVLDHQALFYFSILDNGDISSDVIDELVENQDELIPQVELHCIKVHLIDKTLELDQDIIFRVEELISDINNLRLKKQEKETMLSI